MAYEFQSIWKQLEEAKEQDIDLKDGIAFIDKISARLEAHDGNAAGLMNAISNSEIKGFRKAAASKLHDFMLDNGFLDSSPPLSPLEVELAVVARDDECGTSRRERRGATARRERASRGATRTRFARGGRASRRRAASARDAARRGATRERLSKASTSTR